MKLTKNQEKIIKFFEKNHLLTGVELVEKLNEIDKTTVYRNLDKLVANGLLKELNLKKGITSYELADKDHQHFTCSNCRKIYAVHIDNEMIKKLLNGASIESIELNIRGKCKNCV